MSVVHRDNNGGNTNTGTTVVVAKPTLIANGDVLLVVILSNPITSHTDPSGLWTQIGGNQDNSLTGFRATLWRKLASSEPTSWTWNLGTTSTFTSGAIGYSGADQTTPINAVAGTMAAAGTTDTSPLVTPTVPNCMIVAIFADDNWDPVNVTPESSPITAIERIEFGPFADQRIYIEEYLQGAAAAIQLTATTDDTLNREKAAFTVAIAPVAAGSAPANTTAPLATGNPWQGQTIGSDSGIWTNSPTGYTYQWQRDVAGNGVFSNIAGATSSTRVLAAADVGNKLRCNVTATNAFGTATQASNEIGRVGPSFTVSVVSGFEFCGNVVIAYTPGGAPPIQTAGLVPI